MSTNLKVDDLVFFPEQSDGEYKDCWGLTGRVTKVYNPDTDSCVRIYIPSLDYEPCPRVYRVVKVKEQIIWKY